MELHFGLPTSTTNDVLPTLSPTFFANGFDRFDRRAQCPRLGTDIESKAVAGHFLGGRPARGRFGRVWSVRASTAKWDSLSPYVV